MVGVGKVKVSRVLGGGAGWGWGMRGFGREKLH